MSDIKRIFQISGVYVAIILGAGFASGQEISNFFVQYGAKGIFGLLISGIIFAFIGWATLDICLTKEIKDYDDFLNYIMGNYLGRITKYIVFLFLFILFATMLAAGGATLEQFFGFNYNVGVIIVGGVCFITLLFDMKGIVEINSILAPIMIIGGVFVSLYIFYTDVSMVFLPFDNAPSLNWATSSIIYSSYNILTAITVLSSLGILVNKKKVAFYSGISGGIAITLLGIAMFFPLFQNYLHINQTEIPFLKMLENKNMAMEYLYLILILLAIYTTAISNAFALFQGVFSKLPFNKTLLKFLLVAVAILASQLGFSNIVAYIYPLFGVFGIFQIAMILLTFFLRK